MKTEHNGFISLAGKNSHKLKVSSGQGSLSIGTKGISDGKYDVWVEPDVPIFGDAFNEHFTPYAAQNASSYPYGDWPRSFYYSGNDTGFVEWAFKRRIEQFHWFPKKEVVVDLTQSEISGFYLNVNKNKISVKIGDKLQKLYIIGNLENIEIQQCNKVPIIFLNPQPIDDKTSCFIIPNFKMLSTATDVTVSTEVMGAALDCRSLLQFTNLQFLSLEGNLTNLSALSQLKQLKSIELRYIPNLTDFPKLDEWKSLRRFIGWNIEENIGKRLKSELKVLMLEKEFNFSDISQLRKKVWFDTELDIPFSAWEGKNAKSAIKLYKTCLKEIKKIKTEQEAYASIVNFINSINQLDGIETSEREDVEIAVEKLILAKGF